MSKMIRKTLSLVLALSLVYLMSASAFATNYSIIVIDTYQASKDYDDGATTVEVYATIDLSCTYGSTSLNCIDTGVVYTFAECLHTPLPNGVIRDTRYVTEFNYSSVYYTPPEGCNMVGASYEFGAEVPTMDGGDQFITVTQITPREE